MPDHTIPGAWAGRLSLPGDWTPYHTVPGQWVGDATATTPSAWPVATVAATAIETSTAYDRASAWPLAAIDATGVAPSTSATTPSAWPSASVEATGNAPTTVVTYASFWPVASTEVTAFAPSTTSSASLVEDWYWHVLSLTHNGNLPEDAGNYVGLASTETTGVTLDSSGDVLANVSTLPNLTNPLNNNFTHTSNASGADVDKVFVDVPNFYGQPTSGTDFDTSVNVLVATWQHFDTEWSTDPEILLMSSIAEPGVGNAFSWTGSAPGTCTRAEFDDWASFNKSSTRRNWFTSTLITEAASDEPSGTFAAIDPMAYIWDAIRGTDLNDFDCADWYSDAAPHGNPDWYAALGMTIWTIMMDREGVSPIAYPSGDVTWPTGVTTAFQNAASAFATRLSNLVDGTAATPNAPQTDEIDIATGSGSSEIDVTVNSVPETLTNIEYSVNGGSSWANLGRTTAGSQTLTMAAGSTSYSFLWRYTNATGTGQVSVSSSGGHWTATSSAGSGVNSSWPVASVEITGLVPTASTTTASAWPVAATEITGIVPSTGSSIASTWPVAGVDVTGLVPTTAVTVASSWPVGAAEITGFAPTTVEGGSAAWTSWMTAGTVSEGSDGESWSDAPSVSNLSSDNGVEATILHGTAGNLSNTVTCTNFGFDTGDIPASSTINGIEVRFTDLREAIGGDRPWDIGTLDLTGVTSSTAKTDVLTTKVSQGAGGTSPQTVTIGGDSDIWSGTVTDTQVRASAFGITFQTEYISPQQDGSPLAALDMLEVRVNYT